MILPNFLIIGAAKSGTTAIYNYMNQHPDIYFPRIKEPRFFAWEDIDPSISGETIKSIEDYLKLFDNVLREKAIGEASPNYISSKIAPTRIKKYIPNAKLIAILRDPAERVFSSFLMQLRDGKEECSNISQVIQKKMYLEDGKYYQQLSRYFKLFDKSQIKISLYEDLVNNQAELLKKLFSFVGVDESFVPDCSSRPNVSGLPKHKLFHKLILNNQFAKKHAKRIMPPFLFKKAIFIRDKYYAKCLVKPKMAQTDRKKLVDYYKEDINKLEQLIERDLSGWLNY